MNPPYDSASGEAARELWGKRVLVVDGECVHRLDLVRDIAAAGASVLLASAFGEGLMMLAEHRPDLVVTELRLLGSLHYDFELVYEAHDRAIPCAVVTDSGCAGARQRAAANGALALFEKPAHVSWIRAAMDGRFGPEAAPPRSFTAARAEWDHTHTTYIDSGENLTRTAERLDLDRTTVRRILRMTAPTRRSGAFAIQAGSPHPPPPPPRTGEKRTTR